MNTTVTKQRSSFQRRLWQSVSTDTYLDPLHVGRPPRLGDGVPLRAVEVPSSCGRRGARADGSLMLIKEHLNRGANYRNDVLSDWNVYA